MSDDWDPDWQRKRDQKELIEEFLCDLKGLHFDTESLHAIDWEELYQNKIKKWSERQKT